VTHIWKAVVSIVAFDGGRPPWRLLRAVESAPREWVLTRMTMAGGVFAWDAELMAMPDRTSRGDRAVWSRLGAVALALWWATGFFGVIDLLVGITPLEFPGFEPFVVVETSWGLLFTALVPMPLIAWAVRPVGWVGPQVLAVAAAVMVAGIAATAWGQVLVAVLVAACAGFPRMWRPRPDLSIRRVALSRPFWPVDALVVVGLTAAVVHAWDVLATARTGVKDDDTWYLMHLPMQAGFALAVPAAAAVAVLAMANGVANWWFAIVPPAASAAWFGIVCASHPALLGSVGATAGWCTTAWGMAIAVAVWATGYAQDRAHVTRMISA